MILMTLIHRKEMYTMLQNVIFSEMELKSISRFRDLKNCTLKIMAPKYMLPNGDYGLTCAGEMNNALYFYLSENDFCFYTASVMEVDKKKLIDFKLVRSKTTKGDCYFATQQPFFLEHNSDGFTLESFDIQQSIPLDYCARLLKEIKNTPFFCHRGRCCLLSREPANETKVVNAGSVMIIFTENRYLMKGETILGMFLTKRRNSVYAQDCTPIYILCTNAILVIGPLLDHFIIDIKTSKKDYIAGVQDNGIVINTPNGLVKIDLGKKHEEMCEELKNIERLKESEIVNDRREISRIHEELAKLKIHEGRLSGANSKLKKENETLRRESTRTTTNSDSLSLQNAPVNISNMAAPQVSQSDKPGGAGFVSKFAEEFEVESLLGEGFFGCVFKAKNRFDGWNYAVKRIVVGKREQVRALREIQALVQLDHPGVVRYNHSWIEAPTEEWQNDADSKIIEKIEQTSSHLMTYSSSDVIIYIQMQLCNYSLEHWLERNKTTDSRSLVRMKMWFKQMTSAVAYIHERKLIHRDLKPSNIMFVDENRLKVCDLGTVSVCRENEDPATMATRTKIGTPLYQSPEQHFSAPYSFKTDVFSLGLILAEISVPMTTNERAQTFGVYRLGRKTDFVAERCPEVAEFVTWLTQKQFLRPNCAEVLAHPFLLDIKCAYCSA